MTQARAIIPIPASWPRVPAWGMNLLILGLIAALYPVKVLLEQNLDPYFYQVLMLIGLNVMPLA